MPRNQPVDWAEWSGIQFRSRSMTRLSYLTLAALPFAIAGCSEAASPIAAAQTRTVASTPAAAATAPVRAVATSPAAPVLVELFTSQGCSSCPPADAVLARVEGERNVVAISRPVTYWDRLGWRDTLGRQENTDRQHGYADRGLGGGGSFTPEAVVNGKTGIVGSQEAQLRRLIAAARSAPEHRLSATANGAATSGTVSGPAEIHFVAVANMRSVRIGGGENGGRTVRYHNVVLDEASVGCAPGARCTANIPARIAATSGKDRVAAILQRPNHGEVLAVSWL
jgi:hypothetical protein